MLQLTPGDIAMLYSAISGQAYRITLYVISQLYSILIANEYKVTKDLHYTSLKSSVITHLGQLIYNTYSLMYL